MSVSAIITGALVDMAKKFAFELGKKVLHGFKDSAAGKEVGQIINYRHLADNKSVVLFVHGFSGDASETFGHAPDMLMNNPHFNGWDIFSVGYSSDVFPSIGKGLWSVNPDIKKIALYLETLVKIQFDAYDRVAFVAHSMGGLAVQRAILDLPDTHKKRLSHVLLFGTPSDGLLKAYWFRFWSNQIKDLSSKSDFIKNLRKDWKAQYNSNMPFDFMTIAGSTDEFVPESSSLEPFEKKYRGIIEGNHINMIKPLHERDENHQSYVIIWKVLTKSSGPSKLVGNTQVINNTIARYQTTISKYFEVSNQIAEPELKELIFALENTGEVGKALHVLERYPDAFKNSDLLGIMGGRYKRLYLLNGDKKDLDKAESSYATGLEIAQSKEDKQQIFYHAINLAFLSIVAQNDRGNMQTLAELALQHCVSEQKDLWELSTMAEANMYLGDMTKAETYYRASAQMAGTDVRAKQSIYSNAYYGFRSLMAAKNEESSFVQLLEELFLN